MVANAVKDGITYYEYENIKKNHFVAVATEDPSDNWGLPFWLGKVVQKKEQCTELRAEDHSEEEELEDGVLVEEYAQSQRNPVAAGKGKNQTRTYEVRVEAAAAGKKRATKALRTWIPTTAILYQFEKLTSNKSIMKEDANFVAYNAEIMLKVDCDVNPVGVAELNAELGYKMLPKRTW